jgi:hypothetical protein
LARSLIVDVTCQCVTEEEGAGKRRLDEDEVRLEELLDDLAIDNDDEPEPDQEGTEGALHTIHEGDEGDDGANDPVAIPPGQATAFDFNPSGMKFV